MQCPTCASDRTQRQRVAYESGTTTGTATCAPPERPRPYYVAIGLGSIVLWIVLLQGYFLIPAILMSAALIQWRQPQYQEQMAEYRLQLRRYEQSWICHPCGAMWCEDTNASANASANTSANINAQLQNDLLDLKQDLVEKIARRNRLAFVHEAVQKELLEYEHRSQQIADTTDTTDKSLSNDANHPLLELQDHADRLKLEIEDRSIVINELKLKLVTLEREILVKN